MNKHSFSPEQLYKFKKRFAKNWTILSAVLIALWTVWTLLDAFVIPRDIISQSDLSAVEETQSGESDSEVSDLEALEEEKLWELLTNPVITDTSYNSGKTQIEISYRRTLNTDIYIADITLCDPDDLRTALAEGSFGRNLTDTTSSMAEQNDAILAINGDYYGFRDTGYVVRGGFLYRSTPAKDPEQEDLVFYEDGSVGIVREADQTAREIMEAGGRDIFSFGPGLVTGGEVCVDQEDEVERAQVTNPRTAFGAVGPLHYLFVVSDGRTKQSPGLSLFELAGLMKDLGCVTAYNLDGGGSSTIWFNGKVLNHPTTYGDTFAERNISDIVYIRK